MHQANLWSKCSAALWFRYKSSKLTVWLPQGTAVHAGVEHLLNDLSAGVQRDKDYYLLMVEMGWDEEVEKAKGIVYNKKGWEMTEVQKQTFTLEDAQHWFSGFYDALQDGGTIDGFDPRSVTETEVDAIRQVSDWGLKVGLKPSFGERSIGWLMLMVLLRSWLTSQTATPTQSGVGLTTKQMQRYKQPLMAT